MDSKIYRLRNFSIIKFLSCFFRQRHRTEFVSEEHTLYSHWSRDRQCQRCGRLWTGWDIPVPPLPPPMNSTVANYHLIPGRVMPVISEAVTITDSTKLQYPFILMARPIRQLIRPIAVKQADD